MPNWKRDARGTEKVAILLFERFSNHCLANAVEPLRAANDFLAREAYRWEFVTLDGQGVSSSSGLPVVPNRSLRAHGGGAFLFVASSYDVRSHATDATRRALRAAAKRFETVVGMDTGAWLMADAGLLDGCEATIHWDERIAFAETFVDVDVSDAAFVADGTRMTCGGAMTTFDLVLGLIASRHGEALRLEVARLFQPPSGSVQAILPFGRKRKPVVEKALSLMSGALETPLSIRDIVSRLNTTQRGLNRAFQADLGASAAQVYKRLRLAEVRRLAQHSHLSITEIALRCGYRNAASMTRAFVEEYGRPPSTYRTQD